MSSAGVTVERVFGILKARWRYLLKCLDNRIKNVTAVIMTCCILHNICQMRKDEYIDKDGMLDEILRKERLEDEIGDKNMMLIQLWNLYILH